MLKKRSILLIGTLIHLFLGFLFLPLSLQAQPSTYLQADSLFWTAVHKKETGKFDEALQLQEQAAALFRETDSTAREIACYLEGGILYLELRNPAQALTYFQKAQNRIKQSVPPLHPVSAEFHSDISMYFFATGNIDSALYHNEKALQIWQLNYGFKHLKVARAYKEKGDILGRIGEYTDRKKSYALSLSIRKDLLDENHKDWGGSMMDMALFHFQAGDYQRALAFHGAALEIWTRTYGPDSFPRMGEGYLNLGSDLLRLGSHEKALEHFDHSARVMRLHHSNDYFQIPFVEYAKGVAFLEMGKADSSRYWLDRAQASIAKQNMPVLTYLSGKCELALGDLKFNAGELEAAYVSYRKAHKTLLAIAGPNNAQTIRSDLKQVSWWKKKGDLDSAQFYLDQLEQKLVTGPGASPNRVPSPAEVINPLFYLNTLVLSAELKEARSPHSLEGLQAAGKEYARGIRFVKDLRDTYTLPSRLALREGTQPLYEGAILNQIKTYELSGNSADLEKGFEILELTKALSLWDQMQPTLSEKFNEIPDSLMDRERELRGELDKLRQQISTQSTGFQALQQLQESYEQLHDSLVPTEETFLFERLKNASLSPSRFKKEIAKNAPETGFLDFFFGEKNLILFVVTKDTLLHAILPLSEDLQQDLNTVRKGQRRLMRYADEKKAYTAAAHRLGLQLVMEPLKGLATAPQNLVIIADGALESIAFEALLTDLPDTNGVLNFRTFPWLIGKYPISYGHSAGLTYFNWRRPSHHRTQPEEQVLAFAPVNFPLTTPVLKEADPEERLLSSLVYSEAELGGIRSELKGAFFQYDEASRQQFLDEAEKDFSIIHLATHANASDQCPECSWIAFSDGYLYPHDILKLHLQAQLVVLSACTTDFGRAIPGEGMLSLSRYFLLAGCPSTVAGKWEYNDATTAEIMEGFYQGIARGIYLDQALQQSKLAYLKENELLTDHPDWAQPFFWATATLKGDRNPVIPAPPRYGIALLCFLGMVFILGGLTWLLNRPKRAD